MIELENTQSNGPKIGDLQISMELARTENTQTLKARDDTGASYAVKVFNASVFEDDQSSERFASETTRMRAVNHQNVAAVKKGGSTESGEVFLATEFIQGPTLEKLINDKVQLNIVQIIDLLLQACEGLQACLQQDVLHLNLHPGNLMVDSSSHKIKIVDFGLARLLWGESIPSPSDSARSVYCAPEQKSDQVLDQRTDMYCLGAVFYHLICGQAPQPGAQNNPQDIRKDIPAETGKAISKMMESDPANRFADYTGLKDTLNEAKSNKAEQQEARLSESESDAQAEIARKETTSSAPSAYVDRESDSSSSIRSSGTGQDMQASAPPGGVSVDISREVHAEEERSGRFHPLLLVGALGLVGLLIIAGILIAGSNEENSGAGSDAGLGKLLSTAVNKIFPSSSSDEDKEEMIILRENKIRMDLVLDMIDTYTVQEGRAPSSLEIMIKKKYLEQDEIRDSWNRKLIYSKRLKALSSKGADGIENTSDDWKLDMDGKLLLSPDAFKVLVAEEEQFGRKGRM